MGRRNSTGIDEEIVKVRIVVGRSELQRARDPRICVTTPVGERDENLGENRNGNLNKAKKICTEYGKRQNFRTVDG